MQNSAAPCISLDGGLKCLLLIAHVVVATTYHDLTIRLTLTLSVVALRVAGSLRDALSPWLA